LRRSDALSAAVGSEVWLKLESEQVTGSFKVRGAANALLQLNDEQRRAGVVAVSSGNHGRAVAHVAAELGIAATICLTSRVPDVKVAAISDLGATVVVAGSDQETAEAHARGLVEAEGMTFVHPFDDPDVICGQGTIGLEILDERALDQIVVPLSGGGLIGGIALAIKAISARSQVIGVSQDRGPAMVRSLAAGELVEVIEEGTLADALAGGLGPENRYTFGLCRSHVDHTTLVSEDEIAAAMRLLYRAEGLTIEGGGAVGVAALMAGRVDVSGDVVVVISGGNISPQALARVVETDPIE
jgi:threonine dehydratase